MSETADRGRSFVAHATIVRPIDDAATGTDTARDMLRARSNPLPHDPIWLIMQTVK